MFVLNSLVAGSDTGQRSSSPAPLYPFPRVRGNPKVLFSALFPEPVRCTGAEGAGAADARTRTEKMPRGCLVLMEM